MMSDTRRTARRLLGAALACGTVALGAPALAAPRAAPVPGGIAIVPLGKAAGTAPVVHFGHRRILVERNDGRWEAIVGIPLSAKAGEKRLTVKGGAHARHVAFTVDAKTYPAQHITIHNKHLVDPTKKDLKRIYRELHLIRTAYAQWQPQLPNTRFITPVHGIISSPFGLRRFFNGEPRSPHSGIDIAAPQGTPILAPAAGKVVRVGKYFFTGNTVMVDHGEGLVTVYCHMHKVKVKVGERVKQGQELGTVGMTGRATGPHLHWGVSLNNTRVDPTLFLRPTTVAALEGKDK